MISPALEKLADAAAELVECMRVLAKSKSNLVAELLAGRDFIQYEHYPPGDVCDTESQSQYYFHAHAPQRGEFDDYGHIHTFIRAPGIPPHMQPLASPEIKDAAAPPALVSHLIAISMDRQGQPVRLFTTNRWVTNEIWYRSEDVTALLDQFKIDLSWPSWPLNKWLSAMLVVFRPDIEALIAERDEKLAQWMKENPGRDVFEDRSLEIMSWRDINLAQRLDDIRAELSQALQA